MAATLACKRPGDNVKSFMYYLFSGDAPDELKKYIQRQMIIKKHWDFQEYEFRQYLELSDEELMEKFLQPRKKSRPPLKKPSLEIDDIIADLF